MSRVKLTIAVRMLLFLLLCPVQMSFPWRKSRASRALAGTLNESIKFEEIRGEGSRYEDFLHISIESSGAMRFLVNEPKQNSASSKINIKSSQFLGIFKNTFLPYGYPNSVPAEYMTYQSWNIVQDFCSYLRGIMSIQAVLMGLGVGRADVTALAATVQWIIRDGTSMIGGLLFTYFSSSNFGQNIKSWRLFGDFINNVGITLEMIAPLFSRQFLVLICIASLCKSLCGIAAGAANVGIANHFCSGGKEKGSISDVLAKNGAQHTLISLLGLAISVKFASFANKGVKRQLILYGFLTAIHMYCNVVCMRVLALKSVNISRFKVILDEFFSDKEVQAIIRQTVAESSVSSSLLSAASLSSPSLSSSPPFSFDISLSSIAKKEPLLLPILPKILRAHCHQKNLWATDYNIRYKKQSSGVSNRWGVYVLAWGGPSLLLSDRHANKENFVIGKNIVRAMNQYKLEKYCIVDHASVLGDKNIDAARKQCGYLLWFEKGCRGSDVARGTFEAEVLKHAKLHHIDHIMSNSLPLRSSLSASSKHKQDGTPSNLCTDTTVTRPPDAIMSEFSMDASNTIPDSWRGLATRLYKALIDAMIREGWDVEEFLLPPPHSASFYRRL